MVRRQAAGIETTVEQPELPHQFQHPVGTQHRILVVPIADAALAVGEQVAGEQPEPRGHGGGVARGRGSREAGDPGARRRRRPQRLPLRKRSGVGEVDRRCRAVVEPVSGSEEAESGPHRPGGLSQAGGPGDDAVLFQKSQRAGEVAV